MKKKISFLTAMIFIMTLFSACTESSGGEPEYTEAPPVTAETSVTEETLPAETTVTLREDTIPNICSSRYGYYSLNADEKSVYDEIVNGAHHFEETIELTRTVSKERLEEICKLIYLEETSLYYISKEYSVSFNAETEEASSVQLSYVFDYDEVNSMNVLTEQRVSEILAKITPEMDTVDTIKLFHDEIILNCKYSVDGKYISTPYGAFVDGSALCEGYARAFAILCNKVGIENLFATGSQVVTDQYGNQAYEEHIWNMVKVDGLWYNIDLTWDDPTTSSKADALDDAFISYSYFLFPRFEVKPTVMIDETLFTLPEANSLEANYFVHYGYYATTYEEAVEILTRSINEAYDNGEHYVRIKFSDSTLYKEVVYYMFKKNMIFDLAPGKLPQSISLYWNENARSFQIEI